MQKRKNNILKVTTITIALVMGASAITSMQNVVPTYATQERSVESTDVITSNTNWKYLDNNTDPSNGVVADATKWTLKGFNDTAWKTSSGKFGAKRGALADLGGGCTPTVLLNQYIDGASNPVIPTYFFRTTVQINNVDDITSLKGTIKADDGVAVYLNGQKIVEDNMQTDASKLVAAPNMFYAGTSMGSPAVKDFTLTKQSVANTLVEGENVIAIELHNDRATSSDIYFEFTNLQAVKGEVPAPPTQKAVSMQVGKDETERNMTWYSNQSGNGQVHIAKKSTMVGNTFPTDFTTYDTVGKVANDTGFYSNQTTITNLEENTEYVYRVVNGTTISNTYSFITGAFANEFNFLLAGDPQIGASGNANSDATAWNETLEKSTNAFNPEFLVTAGDQVNTASKETEYTGYLSSDMMTKLPNSTIIGNHDTSSAAYQEHFNLPNESDKGNTTAGGDYWYVYNNTLFMNLNTNNRSTAEHKAFMEEAIANNPNIRWKTVVFHHSIYSTASHVSDNDIIQRRNELPAVFEELDIDVVLMGHDHVYTRTYMMNGMVPDTSNGVQSSVVDPTGILYLTANSASGSKYYEFEQGYDVSFAAKKDQSKTRTMTNVEVTDNSYTMTTYYIDTMQVLDTFTIHKTPIAGEKIALDETIKLFEQLDQKEYTADSWGTFKLAMDNAYAVLQKEGATQQEIDDVLSALKLAKEGLVKEVVDTLPKPDVKPELEAKPEVTLEQKPTVKPVVNETIKDSAIQTGDETDLAMMATLFMVATGCIVVMMKKKKEN